jgi:hypothetical protein
MFRTPNVTMDNRAGTSVIVRILPEPQDVLEGDLANCAGTPSDRVQLHDRGEGSPSLLATASDAKARAPGRDRTSSADQRDDAIDQQVSREEKISGTRSVTASSHARCGRQSRGPLDPSPTAHSPPAELSWSILSTPPSRNVGGRCSFLVRPSWPR